LCRPNEAQGLLEENIDFVNKKILLATVLTPKKGIKNSTKTRQVKPLPIIPEIEECLKSESDSPLAFTLDGRPYTLRRLEKIWYKASTLANEKYGTKIVNLYNSFRHSFGMQRLDDGFSLEELREVYGHSTIATTQRYADYQTGRLVDIMRGKKKVNTQLIEISKQYVIENYKGNWSGREDLNLRHLTPHASALPGCATPR